MDRYGVVYAAMKEWGKDVIEGEYVRTFGGRNHGTGLKNRIPREEDAATGRALRTLANRGYLEAVPGETHKPFSGRQKHNYKIEGYRPTERGREVADEILRRVNDGRYVLDFDTLPLGDES